MKRVLIVDDASFVRWSLRMMLEKNGYEIVGEAANGKMAVQKVRELNPDIVTMDITMPEMDGIQAVKVIKEMETVPKIIMISALGQETHVREAVISGAAGFIVKPFKEEQVLKALSKL